MGKGMEALGNPVGNTAAGNMAAGNTAGCNSEGTRGNTEEVDKGNRAVDKGNRAVAVEMSFFSPEQYPSQPSVASHIVLSVCTSTLETLSAFLQVFIPNCTL